MTKILSQIILAPHLFRVRSLRLGLTAALVCLGCVKQVAASPAASPMQPPSLHMNGFQSEGRTEELQESDQTLTPEVQNSQDISHGTTEGLTPSASPPPRYHAPARHPHADDDVSGADTP